MGKIENTNANGNDAAADNGNVTAAENSNTRRYGGRSNSERMRNRNDASGVALSNQQIASYLGLKNTTSLRIFSNALQITRNVKKSAKRKARVTSDNCGSSSDTSDDDCGNSAGSGKDSISHQQVSGNTSDSANSTITNATNRESNERDEIIRILDRGITSSLRIPNTTNTNNYSADDTNNSSGNLARRQIGGRITSVRGSTNTTNADNYSADDTSNSSGNVVRRQIGGSITSVRGSNTTNTDNYSADDTSNSRGHVVRRQIGGITSVRISNTTSNSGAGDTGRGGGNTEGRQISSTASVRYFGSASNSNGDDASGGKESAKRQKISHGIGDRRGDKNLSSVGYHPSSFVTWNCNGFSTRAVHNRDELRRLVRETRTPDLICIQEARLRAAGPGQQRGQPAVTDKDHPQIRAAVADAFEGYTPFWSLADKRYAGTLTLVRKACLEAGGSSPTRNRAGNYDPDLVAFTPRSAIDLMLHRLGTTRAECGLEAEQPEAKSAAAAQPKKQQTSLTSFFAPKKKQGAGATGKRKRHDHNAEGRFQFFFFPGMDVLQTYVPNNGEKEESFRRRREWDKSMNKFFAERKQILQSINNSKGSSKTGGDKVDSGIDRKLLWCGESMYRMVVLVVSNRSVISSF